MRGPTIALVLAAILLLAGAAVAWLGTHARQDADRDHAAAQRQLASARGALRRAQSDLSAAQDAVATFQASASGASTATEHVVDLEGRLADQLDRLRRAGASADIGTYNQVVGELNATTRELVTALNALPKPLGDVSRALSHLPTARCPAPAKPTITWTAYGGNGLQCAQLQVPLDYAAPHGEQIEITVVRRPADDPATSLGPLVTNPGGPGGSGVNFMRQAPLLLPPDVLRRFDLIGFDPRGVGRSTPVDCADNLDPLFSADVTAPTPETHEHAVDAIKAIVEGCATRTGALLRHVDTVSSARDIDRIREALGVEKISYLGFSYGTYLGSVYADLFPKHVRAAVLDGAVDPRHGTRAAAVTSSDSFDNALRDALDDCADDPTCPFYANGDPETAYDELMTAIGKQPLDVAGRRIGRVQAELAVLSGLYAGREEWPRLIRALADAAANDGKELSTLVDRYTGRRADGSYSNSFEALYAINCTDLGGRLTPEQAHDTVLRLPRNPSRFKSVNVALALPCAFWPAPAHGAPGPLHADGAPSILVIGGVYDPVTPIESAKALAEELHTGVLVTSELDGHTSFGRGSECIDDIVVHYLINEKAPEYGIRCPAD